MTLKDLSLNIRIYGKPDCVWCNAAKNLLDSKGISYTYTDLFELEPQKAQFILDKSRMRSVPIIYDWDNLIGGFDALEGYLQGKGI